jgi:serine/threonine-protein kinase RsbW
MSGAPPTQDAPDSRIGRVELRIPNRAEWVAVARLTIAAIANRLPFSVEDIEDLKLAIAEACTTVIQAGEGDGTIDIICETDPAELRVHVRDERPGRADLFQERSESSGPEGLGVFLIQALMDEVSHSADPRTGTELTMIKRVVA